MQRTRTANPVGHFAEHFPGANGHLGEHFPGGNVSLLQQLLAHLQAAHSVPSPVMSPHGFGPGGAVTGHPTPNGGGPELQPGPFKPALPPQPFNFGPHVGPAQLLRGLGQTSQAAALWMQHHPGAMGTGRFIPSWVTPYLPGANAAPQAAAPQAY